jgi:hypothetical protein
LDGHALEHEGSYSARLPHHGIWRYARSLEDVVKKQRVSARKD